MTAFLFKAVRMIPAQPKDQILLLWFAGLAAALGTVLLYGFSAALAGPLRANLTNMGCPREDAHWQAELNNTSELSS
jgi:hypothetical protein